MRGGADSRLHDLDMRDAFDEAPAARVALND
jgi:hypothetical protein